MKEQLRKMWKVVLYYLPKKFAHTYIYNKSHDNKIDINHPKTYDEKIHWLMVNVYDKKYAKYADKIAVRDYVASCGLSELLIPLAGKGIYSSVKEINFDELPDKFILKTNHASGGDHYYICRDKNKVDKKSLEEKFSRALKQNFAFRLCQYHYAGIKPALICEQLLQNKGHQLLTDYKVVCSYGKPIAILVCKDRNDGRDYYSTEWEYMDYVKSEYRSGEIEEKPKLLPEMLKAASILSSPLPLARVDFYIVNNKLYFGEITLTPFAGRTEYLNERGQKEIGREIKLKNER